MPKGSRSGSIIIIPAVRGPRGRILEPEKIFVRRRYVDPKTGRRREKKRLAENRTDAKEKLHELREEILRDQVEVIRPTSKTFAELADYYEEAYLHPPNRKGEGLKSWDKIKSRLKALKSEFGDEPLNNIDYERIDKFRKRFADTPIVRRRPGSHFLSPPRLRGIASVNRALSLLRRMLNIARQKRTWGVTHNPFEDGDALIRVAKEVERMRILSHAEEKRLLATVRTNCGSGRADARHYCNLYPAIIFAIDTAARAGEQFSTRVCDVDLDEGLIRIGSHRAKTGQERIVPITSRLRAELLKLKPIKRSRRSKSPASNLQSQLIFDFIRPKRSFAGACKSAGIDNFRWHDLRHTGTMRMIEAGERESIVMKITGHTNYKTFMRYVNLNPELVRAAARKIDLARAPKRKRA